VALLLREQMLMCDPEIAKRQLQEKGYSLVIANKGKIIFEIKSAGIGGFLDAIEKFGRSGLDGAFIADKIVGRAAALLCVYCGVKGVYAIVLSKGGKQVLDENSIPVEFESLVPRILNRPKTDMCPFEKAVAAVSNAEEAYEKLKSCMERMEKYR
jgi:hypothetical protein